METQVTITEALSELKLISKKIAEKRNVIATNTTRTGHLPDPLGDSKKYIDEELQAIQDLVTRFVAIKAAIAVANNNVKVEVEGITRTVAEWLIYKRDCMKPYQEFIGTVLNNHNRIKKEFERAPKVYNDAKGEVALVQLVSNIDEKLFIKENEKMIAIAQTLDGKLSLVNATTTILI